MSDYIPNSDAEFQTWQTNFLSYANDNAVELGITNEDLEPLNLSQSNWENDYNAATAAAAAAAAAKQQKTDSRQDFEAKLRNLTQQLQKNPDLTNAHRASLGITIPQNRSNNGVPTTRPIATITNASNRSHTINFFDETTPTRRAKPKGVMGVEVWVKVGDSKPIEYEKEMRFLGLDTRTPYVSEFEADEIGQTAYYHLRWVNRKGEPGPWSDCFVASING